MKRIPSIVAVLTASFLIICLLQARGRGLGFAPPVTEWEMHPAWWHFSILADVGEYLVALPAVFFVALPAAKLLGVSSGLTWISISLVIASESALVFYATRFIGHHFKQEPNQVPVPMSPSGRHGAS